MQNSTTSGQTSIPNTAPNTAPNAAYAPSVPISVYRELSAELQATKALLDSVNHQNQQLAQQNHKLRQEIETVAQAALRSQQTASAMQPVQFGAPIPPSPSEQIASQIRTAAPRVSQHSDRPNPTQAPAANTKLAGVRAEELFTETGSSDRPSPSKSSPRQLNGFWLWLTVLAVIITAFGAGFLMVRPILSNR
jgi:hypothetical protein